ncbi:kinase-like domain-containing protein [Dactylonectria macrodidyma]|uniref:Kinase-like domain-containing protein n=1 Tax=Dactylonectria macrodidyma TaxID=307937 RepID=A0A9P9FV45_9HYPO|nr:kinase-like domain-containing protein [Dactylonectria macrodidyma]
MFHEPGTVFYLVPQPGDRCAKAIVDDDTNQSRLRGDPFNPSVRYLRIGLNQVAKVPDRLVTFGHMATSDIILRDDLFSTADHCYFDFHPTTGELLLHDISKVNKTELFHIGQNEVDQLWTSPRQCVVRYDREYIITIGRANFRLVPRHLQSDGDKPALFAERLELVRRMPKHLQWYQATSAQLHALKKQWLTSADTGEAFNPGGEDTNQPERDTNQPERDTKIRHVYIQDLGEGAQGSVHEVVDLHTGDHFARKVCRFQPIRWWKILNEDQFKGRIQREVTLVKKASHDHIVPYLGVRALPTGGVVEIFMPVGSASPSQQDVVPDAVCTRTRPLGGIIHRDIKPENILYQGDKFLLTDFGIANDIDASKTTMGTYWYSAPEIMAVGPQTTKVDIYSLGVTYAECLADPQAVATAQASFDQPPNWRQSVQALLTERRPQIAPMLAQDAEQRPEASQLLSLFHCQQGRISMQNAHVGHALSLSGGFPSFPGEIRETTLVYSAAPTQLTPMDWTPTKAPGSTAITDKPTSGSGIV